MQFFTVFSVLAYAVVALAAAVSPDALITRGNTDVSNTISALNQKCDTILPKFGGCNNTQCTNDIVLEVVAAFEVATASCVGLQGIPSMSLAKQITDVVVKVVTAIDLHKSSCGGKCGDLSVYAKIDLCISLWLKQLGICVVGILALVSTLLLNVLLILKGLCLNLVLKVCLFI